SIGPGLDDLSGDGGGDRLPVLCLAFAVQDQVAHLELLPVAGGGLVVVVRLLVGGAVEGDRGLVAGAVHRVGAQRRDVAVVGRGQAGARPACRAAAAGTVDAARQVYDLVRVDQVRVADLRVGVNKRLQADAVGHRIGRA